MADGRGCTMDEIPRGDSPVAGSTLRVVNRLRRLQPTLRFRADFQSANFQSASRVVISRRALRIAADGKRANDCRR